MHQLRDLSPVTGAPLYRVPLPPSAFSELPVHGSSELLGMVIAVQHVQIEPPTDAFDALELSEVLAVVPSDPSAAHTIAAARKHDMEIVTINRTSWRAVEQQLTWPTRLVELSDDPDV